MSRPLIVALPFVALLAAGCEEKAPPALTPSGPAGVAGADTDPAPSPSGPGEVKPPPPASDAQPSSAIGSLPPDGVVAKLGDTTVTRAMFDRAILDRAMRVGVPPDAALGPMRAVFEEPALKHLVRRQALAEEAQKRDLAPPETVVEAKLTEMKQKLPEGITFAQFLERMRTDEGAFRTEMSHDLAIEALMKQVTAAIPRVTEAEAKALYKQNPAVYAERKTATIREILIAAPLGVSNEALAEKKAAADKLRAELVGKGAKAFGEAAQKHSDDPRTRDKGGSLGEVQPSQLLPDLSVAAFTLQKNELSEVIRTEKGFHILFSEGMQKGPNIPFEKAKERILVVENSKRAQDALQKFVEDTTKKLDVDIKVKPAPQPQLPTGPGPRGPGPGGPGPMGHGPGGPGMPPGFIAGGDGAHALPPPSADNVRPGVKNPHGGSSGGDLKMGGDENPLKLKK